MPDREQSAPREQARSSAPTDPETERREAVRKALERHAKKLVRRLEALHGDLEEASRAQDWRRFGEALLTYAHKVPARAKQVQLEDPSDAGRMFDIELDPKVAAPANAARYFKRAAKAERGQRDIPPRIEAVKREHNELRAMLARAAEAAAAAERGGPEERDEADVAHLALERALAALTPGTRHALHAPEPLPRRKLGLAGEDSAKPAGPKPPTTAAPQKRSRDDIPAKFVPWRFRSKEGWDVLIGRSSEANDYLTLHMARPEDYWFHAHGCPGSHVVLRRGKGVNEPSKATLEEVASWAAFHSKLRTAGKAPVIFTQKKYVRKPRGTKAGTVYVEREKLLMVRPVEPPREQMSDAGSATP
jgi:predicted ribosome quality control (RQC) complex YloA/Tae2 family protein